MTAQRPRKSHYLPKFYLAGFTANGEAEGDLYVFDQTILRDWRSSPSKSATERDFYVVDLGPTEDPDVMEKVFSRLEGDFSRVLGDIIAGHQLPSNDLDFNWFLNFVATMVARTPRTRGVAAKAIDRATKAELRKLLATPEGWTQFRQVCGESGREVGEQKYEEYKRFADSEDYTVDFDQTTHVQTMATHMIDALLPALAERHWSLGIAAEDAPDFVCSDMPVGVFPARSADIGRPMTLLSRDTVLSFPINRRLVALARYERCGDVQAVTAQGARLINYWSISGARQVFSPTPELSFVTPGGAICGKAELVALLQRRQACRTEPI
jgi:hypothetical protein